MRRKKIAFGSILTILILLLGIGLPAAAAQDATEVTIDIKPCKDPNVLNVNVIGWLPVAIYEVDVDPETVELEGVPAEEWKWREDYLYWLVKFPAEKVIEELLPVKDGQVLELTLTGELTDGTAIEGHDDVVILKRGRR